MENRIREKEIESTKVGSRVPVARGGCGQSGTFTSAQTGQWGEAGPPQDQPRGMAKWLRPDLTAAACPFQPLPAAPPALRMQPLPAESASTHVETVSSNTGSQFFSAKT
ncbi:unnamed protein product, partial [Iphiclides podalirius]